MIEFAKPPPFLFKRRWRELHRKGSRVTDNISAMGPVNVVFRVTTAEDPATSYTRTLLGTSSICSAANGRPVLPNTKLKLLSNTDQSSAFVHICLRCTGQHGKILRFEDYLIRIGRYSLAQAILNVIRFQLFANSRWCFTGLSAPNMVITGTFAKQLDRASLSKDPQAVVNSKFPGISLNLRSIKSRGTPGLHTRNPSKFIIPGCRDIEDLSSAVDELDEIAGRHFVSQKRKNGPSAVGGDRPVKITKLQADTM